MRCWPRPLRRMRSQSPFPWAFPPRRPPFATPCAWDCSSAAFRPLLGYLAGSTVSAVIARYDHWIAFGLLAFIGGRMLWESARGTEEGGQPSLGALRKLLVLSIATSIDALAVGVSLAVLRENIWVNAAWIGCVTFALSALGVLTGRRLGRRMQRCATVAGGLVLIFIGAKILIEHVR